MSNPQPPLPDWLKPISVKELLKKELNDKKTMEANMESNMEANKMSNITIISKIDKYREIGRAMTEIRREVPITTSTWGGWNHEESVKLEEILKHNKDYQALKEEGDTIIEEFGFTSRTPLRRARLIHELYIRTTTSHLEQIK
jgi:hypothetical protein